MSFMRAFNSESLNVHSIMKRSRANGPGWRTVIWFQGCSLDCPGCFNPDTHSHHPRFPLSVNEIMSRLTQDADNVDGITISGGEPFQQPFGLLSLLKDIRSATRFSIIVFSGYDKEEIMRIPQGRDILYLVDVLVAGRYVSSLHSNRGFRGSTNQKIHLLTNRFKSSDIEDTSACEVLIDAHGRITVSGVDPRILYEEKDYKTSRSLIQISKKT